ncbi:hypothetical protein VC83_06663 [Pseudogymnoascus destructans]|uniref:Uncharacterized protein n=1 Tax=Pseudogymnoascus destructans TaxID=655981 RepID=A0A177A411_9PEZI|nr:uncharacterized protein VC83_06663 [Pseudogymnoascus destructans]OAF56340.1 hypothetical protein VC83_06663 [Pseudogymnoascus destructans]
MNAYGTSTELPSVASGGPHLQNFQTIPPSIVRPAASPGIVPRLAAGAAACTDQVRHGGNDCPKRQKSSMIPSFLASSRTPGIFL